MPYALISAFFHYLILLVNFQFIKDLRPDSKLSTS